jgi:tetratricopeptide (TPR) repeat protein
MPVSPPADTGNANANNVANDNTAGAADGAGFGNGGRISVRPPTAGESNSAAPSNSNSTIQVTPVQNNDSYIYIKVHPAPVSHGKDEQGSSDSGGNAQSSIGTPAPGTNNDMERARYLQGSGHYAEAIRAYRDAMSSGARGAAYQGIAQSYQWMGDSESARASYKEAIQAYEQERTNRPYLAQRGIASCEAALMLLGG